MMAVREWLSGKKTYLLAALLAGATLVLVLLGRLTPHAALILFMIAACGFPVTFRSALARHQAEELDLLEELAITGAAMAAHNLPAAYAAGETIAKQGAALVDECRQEAQ